MTYHKMFMKIYVGNGKRFELFIVVIFHFETIQHVV